MDRPPAVPWWGRVLGWILALSFPLLCLFAIGIRISNRGKEAAARAAWNAFLSTLLIASGMATLAAGVYYWSVRGGMGPPVSPTVGLGLRSLETINDLPAFPTEQPMTPVEVAARTKPLVFIVTPDVPRGPTRGYLETAPIGAAVLLMADDNGYLLGTNRHVVDVPGLFRFGRDRDRVVVVSDKWDFAHASVIGRHQQYDLALLWVDHRGGKRFRQPITAYDTIPAGDPIFAVGHPQRLFFTVSNGLISRVDGAGTLQLSAPISPGNSGGPVYDSQGNLLGIVTSKVDQESSPNAENLNFATRADAFLSAANWNFLGQGRERLNRFIAEAAKNN